MCKIVLSGVNHGVTIIQNRFLDEYLCDASEHELKVYLYLLRYVYSPETDVAIKSIADALGYSKSKVEKALEKWQQERLISYKLNEAGEIEKIYLEDINALPVEKNDDATEEEKPVVKAQEKPAKKPVKKVKVIVPEYSMEQINLIAADETFKDIAYDVEDKLGRPLTQSDFNDIAVYYESFGFSAELISYLYDYCIEKAKTSSKYISAVAVKWAESGIKTVAEAKGEVDSYNGFYISVKGALGKSKELTSEEKKIIDGWIYSEGIAEELVIAACEKAGQNEEVKSGAIKNYVNKILKEWKEAGYKTVKDVEKASAERKNSSAKRTKVAKATGSQISDFPQRQLTKEDATELERKLMARDNSEDRLRALKKKIGIG